MGSFGEHFATNDFVGWGASDEGVSGKSLFTARADARLRGVVFNNPFLKAFDQRTFAAFAVFIKLGFATTAIDIDVGAGTFFIGFCHDLHHSKDGFGNQPGLCLNGGMNTFRQIFHRISYLQYPLLLAALVYYIPFVQALMQKQIEWGLLNQVLILMGVAFSFSTLQDTTTTQNKVSEKVWSHPFWGKAMLLLIAFMAFAFIVFGLVATLYWKTDLSQSVAVGITVLGIGLVGILKAAIEMFENHRSDKQ